MHLKINEKDIMNCSEEDIAVLINNPDFRENESIEYKLTFSHVEGKDNQDKEEKRAEYKCDICSFANADGGYLIYGIAEENGCASSIIGIDIQDDDTDRFERNRRNELNGIQPKIPTIKFAFIKLNTGKYVVVLHVNTDSFTPYVFLEKEKYYRIYRRSGNGKSAIGYTELKRLFNNSLSLEQAVYDYITEKVTRYRFRNEQCGDRFIYLCTIPETFKDSYYNHNMFLMEREQEKRFGYVFNDICCNTPSVPCVDGLHFIPWSDDVEYADCYIKNNGIIEACLSLEKTIRDQFFPWGYLWNKMNSFYSNSLNLYRSLSLEGRVFICLSIIGCKGLMTDSEHLSINSFSNIDRDEILCDPIAITMNEDDESIQKMLLQLKLTFLLSIGVKHRKELNEIITEIQRDGN